VISTEFKTGGLAARFVSAWRKVIDSCRIPPMLRNASIHPGIRLALALLVSVVLHLAAFHFPDYFPKDKPPLPKPENWKFDVVMALRGEGISHKPEAPSVTQKAISQVQGEKNPHAVLLALARKSQEVPTPKIEKTPVILAEEPMEIKSPAIVQQPTDVQKQAEAMAGAMASLVNMQFVLGQMKIFYIATREQIKLAITAKFTEEMLKQYAGAICTLRLSYAAPAIQADSKVDCGEKQELAERLASQIDWHALPQPGKYSLPYRNMKITLWFEGYQTRIGLKADE